MSITPEVSITLSSIVDNQAIATLGSGYMWYQVSGIRQGYKIRALDIDGNTVGEGTLNIDPIYQSSAVQITITSTFDNTSYASGLWTLVEPDTYDLVKLLPEYLRTTLLLPTFLESLRQQVTNPINDAITRLENIRREDKVDFELLKLIKTTLGFIVDIADEEFNEDEHRRLLREIRNFYQISGTKKFIDFFAYVKSANITVEELYTQDYIEFVNSKLTEAYYLTNRVDVTYDLNLYPELNDVERFQRLFYAIAPIVLVVQNFIGMAVNNVRAPFLVGSTGHESVDFSGYDESNVGQFIDLGLTGVQGFESSGVHGNSIV